MLGKTALADTDNAESLLHEIHDPQPLNTESHSIPTNQTIPYDIVLKIIDQLRDDHHALHACSLISHSFVLRCRRYLFSTIHLKTSFRCSEMVRLFPNIYQLIQHLTITDFRLQVFQLPMATLPVTLSSLGFPQPVTFPSSSQGCYI